MGSPLWVDMCNLWKITKGFILLFQGLYYII